MSVIYPFPRVSHRELAAMIEDAARVARLNGRAAVVVQWADDENLREDCRGVLFTYSKADQWEYSDFSRRLLTVDPSGLVKYEAVRA